MSHFAKINSDNIVTEVIVAEQDFIDSGLVGDTSEWVQTSYNNNFRKNYASIGGIYDLARDAFYIQQPYPSWILNETICQWEAPTAMPDDGKMYEWNEETTNWTEIE